MAEETFIVPDMTCGHCRSSIEGALRGLEGVVSVAVDLDTKQVRVAYDAGSLKSALIRETIQEQGFEVSLPGG